MRRSLFAVLLLIVSVGPAVAQDPPPGIRLSTTYQTQNRPLLAVRPFEGAAPIAEALDSLTRIVQRDLTNSSRFNIVEGVPESLRTGDVDYAQWNSLNVVYLVTGSVAPAADGYDVSLTVHDVVYARVVHDGRYVLPAATNPAFRMAVHALSDQVVQSALNSPGSAATRIVTTRQHGDGNYDLLIVDSDGYGLRRIAGFGGLIYSPVWSPDGRRILYATGGDRWQIVEREVATGRQRTFDPGGDMIYTPTYAPNGTTIALGVCGAVPVRPRPIGWPAQADRQSFHRVDVSVVLAGRTAHRVHVRPDRPAGRVRHGRQWRWCDDAVAVRLRAVQ